MRERPKTKSGAMSAWRAGAALLRDVWWWLPTLRAVIALIPCRQK
jgi:hypothetical protein